MTPHQKLSDIKRCSSAKLLHESLTTCSFPDSWDHLVTIMWFSSTYAIDYDIVVGALLSKEMRKRSNKETSTTEAMVVIVRSIEGGKYHKGITKFN
jgi:hypothetical protein